MPRPPGGTTGAGPHRRFHLGEFVHFGPDRGLVQSSYWPVLGRRAWVADFNDFGYPIHAGRQALDPEFRRRYRRRWAPRVEDAIQARQRTMLAAYAHPSCKAILFWTRFALENAALLLDLLDPGPVGAAFLAKARVAYPAQRAAPARAVLRKWASPGPPRIVFCGRDYVLKNGPLALAVLERVFAREPRARCTWIGEIPDAERRTRPALFRRIDHYPRLPRSRVLGLILRAHILFHPSTSESFGMIFLEAAAAGLAIVSVRGPGMWAVPEVVDRAGGLLVDRREHGTGGEEAQGYVDSLGELLQDPLRARHMGLHNHEMTAAGRFCPRARNRQLGAIYEEALAAPAGDPLAIGDVAPPGPARTLRLTTREVEEDGWACRRAVGLATPYLRV